MALALALGATVAWVDRVDAAATLPVFDAPRHSKSESRRSVAEFTSSAPSPVAKKLAMDWVVTNCDDSGSGSLRDAVNQAASGDTIDLGELTCSRISLTTGAIFMAQDNLEIAGPGRDALTIDGSAAYNTGVLFHSGYGTLDVHDLTLAHGTKYASTGQARGGCLFTDGNLSMRDVAVYGCKVYSNGDETQGKGGGIYVAGDASLVHSVVHDNLIAASGYETRAYGAGIYALGALAASFTTIVGNTTRSSSLSQGGGIAAYGGLACAYSTIRGNVAVAVGGDTEIGFGGGIWTYGDTTIRSSTIEGNYADFGAGILQRPRSNMEIVNSTISGNSAQSGTGGIFAYGGVTIANSTIAFNQARNIGTGGSYLGVGLHLESGQSAQLQSTIVANNNGPFPSLKVDSAGAAGAAVTGANNLIGGTFVPAPPDTISADPMLGPLFNQGGPTSTHALLPGSPAINAGNNFGAGSYDQRGRRFPRLVGATADIGAYEFNPDLIFVGTFE